MLMEEKKNMRLALLKVSFYHSYHASYFQHDTNCRLQVDASKLIIESHHAQVNSKCFDTLHLHTNGWFIFWINHVD